MILQEPKTDWMPGDGIKAVDLNRIERNQLSQFVFSGAATAPTFETLYHYEGGGDNATQPSSVGSQSRNVHIGSMAILVPPAHKVSLLGWAARNATMGNTTLGSTKIVLNGIAGTTTYTRDLVTISRQYCLHANRRPTY